MDAPIFIGATMTQDRDFLSRLSPDEAAFFAEFEREANGRRPQTDWGKDRQKSSKRDITNRWTQLPMDMIDETPWISWEMHIIKAIDAERFASEKDDIEPGIIKKDTYYQCSFFTPQKTLRAFFVDLESAQAWMQKTRSTYNKVVR